ncbi:MAG: NAD-dependent epimerase/dehydratase family protein [Rhodospirillales bacterium]
MTPDRPTPARPSLAGRRVAVAGASGLLGSHVAALLAAEGAVVRVSRHRSPLPPEVPADATVEGDLRVPAVAAAFVEGMERVYLCTGVVGGAGMIGRSVAQVTQTLATAVQLLEAAALAGVPRVGVVSSTTVYPPGDYPMREEEGFDGEPSPAWAGLGWMNRSLEKVAAHLTATGALPAAVIRPAAIYGPRDRFGPGAHVIPGLIGRALAREDPFVVWGDGTAVRDFVHAADVARALVDAVELAADAVPSNVGAGVAVTVADLVTAVLEAAGHRPASLVFDATKPTTVPVRRIAVDRARERLGFVPCFELRDGMADTIRWLTDQPPRG